MIVTVFFEQGFLQTDCPHYFPPAPHSLYFVLILDGILFLSFLWNIYQSAGVERM